MKISVERLRRIRLVVSDMDGTLLSKKNELPEITRKLIDQLEQQAKVHFALGTGRPRISAAHPFTDEFRFNTRPGIFLNGAQVHGTSGELVSQSVISGEAVQAVFDALTGHRPHRVSVTLCCGDKVHLLASEDDHAFSNYLAAKYKDPFPTVLSGDEGVNVNMISVLCRDIQDVKSWLIPELEKVAHFYGLILVNSLPNLVSLLPPSTSKAEGVRVLAEKPEISMDEVAAIGTEMGTPIMILKC